MNTYLKHFINNKINIYIICIASLLFSGAISLCIGGTNISFLKMINSFFTQSGELYNVLVHVRLPRTLATLLAGAALATAGVIIQGVLNNPLASPNIIGVNSGAGLGAIIAMVLFPVSYLAVSIGAFIGALTATFCVWFIAGKKSGSKLTIILAGVAINAIANGVMDAITIFFPSVLQGSTYFKVGGVSGVFMQKLSPAWAFIIIGLIISFLLCNQLEALSLGQESAHSIGVNVGFIRFILLVVASLLSASAISFCGLIGFVGLVVPHTVKVFTGNKISLLLPVSCAFGAVFLTLCDVFSRMVFYPYEIPVGIILSLLGGPFFIVLIFRRQRQ